LGALACSLIALLLGSSSGLGGGKNMETVVQDDAQLLHRSPAQVQQSMRRIADLGATHVRLTASWSGLVPSPRDKRIPPAPFDATDSRTYPPDGFRDLDTAVKAATADGLKVMIDLAFWAPRWAVGRPASNPVRERYFPDPAAFADFASAVARRYSGAVADPANPAQKLPAVRMYTTWNEPNHPSFLMPQWAHTPDGGWRPESPHVYRALHNAAYAAIKDVSPADMVLVGGTASTGTAVPGKGGVPPLEFVRTLACVDDQLRPLQVPECRHFTPIHADGFADHPYARYWTPGWSDPNADDVPIADVGRLADLLHKLALRGRIASVLPIYDTDFGYESKEDDPYQPFDRLQQAQFLSRSSYLAWKQPDTQMFAQFLLRDVDPRESGRRKGTRAYYRDFQTGLYDAQGDPKPALEAFKLPFWAQTVGQGSQHAVLLWGQVRPGKGQRTVRVERQDPASGAWAPVRTIGTTCDQQDQAFMTDGTGTFLRTAAFTGPATYRMSWRHDDGSWEPGVPISIAADPLQAPPLTG
jgi:hypothetical protein